MITAELHAHVFMDGIDYKECVNRFKNGVDESAVRSVLSTYREKGITFVRDGGDHFGACLYAKRIAMSMKDLAAITLAPKMIAKLKAELKDLKTRLQSV